MEADTRLRLRKLVALAAAAWCAAAPAAAHHSFAAEYDANQPVELNGWISKVDWMNPHVYFYVDVETPGGKLENWACEMGPPAGLQRSGWTRNTLKVGDHVIVSGSRAKDGSRQMNARWITLADTGKRLGAASSQSAGN